MPTVESLQCPDVTIGIDLGGTGTRLVALDSSGVIRHELSRATPRAGTHDAVGALADLVTEVAANTRPTAIGIGASGPVDAGGIIRNPDTLAAYSGIALAAALTDRLGLPCVIDNDAVTAAIGEHRLGAGSGSQALLTVTLGTGIGVAMLVAGRPVRSADGTHPEGGHIAVAGPTAPCYCWLDPCWEQLASRTALDRLTQGRAAEVAEHARGKDPAAQELFRTYGSRVGAGLATLVTIYRPDRIVLGGGAAQYLDIFVDSMRQGMDRPQNYSWAGPIIAAELGDIAGAVGGAVLAR
jgi:glucokinase